MSPSWPTGSRLALHTIGATAEDHPKALPERLNAATGGWAGRTCERGCDVATPAPLPHCGSVGSVWHAGKAPKLCTSQGRVRLSQSPPSHHPASLLDTPETGGTSPLHWAVHTEQSDCGQCSSGKDCLRNPLFRIPEIHPKGCPASEARQAKGTTPVVKLSP